MSSATEGRENRLDSLKWLAVLLLVGGAIFANYYFADQPLLYRVSGIVAAVALGIVIAMQTAKGDAFWSLLKAARNEARRVTWPTRQERNQTTLIVLVVVLIMSLILWGLDSLFSWLTVLVIG